MNHMQDFERILEEQDRAINKKLNNPLQAGLSRIEQEEGRIAERGLLTEWNARKISDMKRYVKKYKWLPPSYKAMLREWQLPNFS